MIKKLIYHFRNNSFKKVAKKKIANNGNFMNFMYRNYKKSCKINNLYLQKIFLPFPRQSEKFKYYGNYIFNIDPKEVNRVVSSEFEDNYLNDPWRFLQGGSWDKESVDIYDLSEKNDRTITIKTINEIFINKINYKNSTQYKEMKSLIDKGEVAYYWCETLEDLDKYFDTLIILNQDIKNNNYKIQEELKNDYPEVINIKEKGDEIRVMISRSGELVLGSGGTHRLLLAKHNNINKIPVIIEAIHPQFLDKITKKNNKESILNCLRRELNQ